MEFRRGRSETPQPVRGNLRPDCRETRGPVRRTMSCARET